MLPGGAATDDGAQHRRLVIDTVTESDCSEQDGKQQVENHTGADDHHALDYGFG